MKRIDSIRRQRGTQVVELAVALPLLCFLAFMVAEGSGFIRAHQIINNAAREGAHFAAMPENENASAAIQQVVQQYAANNGLDSTKLTVTVDQNQTITFASGYRASGSVVTVAYPYTLQYLPQMPFSQTPGTVTIRAAAEFRNFHY